MRKIIFIIISLITIDEIFKVTSVLFFIPHFNLLIWELDNFTFKVRHFKRKIV